MGFFKNPQEVSRFIEDKLTYFEELASREPHIPQWQRGLRFTRRWQDLAREASPDANEIDELLEAMEKEEVPGSQFCDLYRRIIDWTEFANVKIARPPSHFPFYE